MHKQLFSKKAILLITFLFLILPVFSKIIYVNVANTSSTKNGTSWSTSYSSLQQALDNASNGDTLRVAQGIYYPTESPNDSTSNARDRAFHIANKDIVMSGSWNASTGSQNGDTTYLSGDIGTTGVNTDNAYHVFVGFKLTNKTVIKDIAFISGYADGASYSNIKYVNRDIGRNYGGGIYMVRCSPLLSNLTFRNNFGIQSGGGIYFTDTCSPVVDGCTFFNNGGWYAGGIDVQYDVNLKITNSIFYNNAAGNLGGAISNIWSDLTIENCFFLNNSGGYGAGAIFNRNDLTYINTAKFTITNSTFIGNTTSASGGGGAILVQNSKPLLTNNVFFKNTKSGTADVIRFWNIDTLNPSSTNNATDAQLSLFPNSNINLSGKFYKDLFVDSIKWTGTDGKWRSKDDGAMIISSSVLKSAGVSGTGIPTKDITSTKRPSPSSIGAYDFDCPSATATINRDVCNTYKSPSGKTWTISGSYADTIASYRGCDSVITVNLTVRKKSTDTLNLKVCDTTYSQSGSQMWTKSGRYQDTILNAAGCDSIITVDLVVSENSFATINPNVCNNYLSPSGQNWNTSGNYTATIANTAGCDSIITINLTIRESTEATINPIVCDTFFSPSGQSWINSGTYIDTIANAAGCDSIITINLIVSQRTFEIISRTSCDSFISPSGKIWITTGSYIDTIANNAGCDSIMTIDLTILRSTTSITNQVACDSFSWNGEVYRSTGSYQFKTTNSAGCDSAASLDLVINNSTRSLATITSCGSYQWNGKDYSATGQYQYLTSNAQGCDSVAVLELTITTVDLDAEFVIASQLLSKNLVSIVNISTIKPDSVQWILPDPVYVKVLKRENNELLLEFADSGSFEIGLRTYQGNCSRYFAKSFVVLKGEAFPIVNGREPFVREYLAFPNPSNGQFKTKIILSAESDVRIRILDPITSQVLDQRILTGKKLYEEEYNLSLKLGVYIMLLETPQGNFINRIVIQ